MSERRVASGLQRLMFAPRADQSALGWPLSDESKELARAIRMVASPAPNVTRTDDHLLRVVVWFGCLLWCALVWTTVACLAAVASTVKIVQTGKHRRVGFPHWRSARASELLQIADARHRATESRCNRTEPSDWAVAPVNRLKKEAR